MRSPDSSKGAPTMPLYTYSCAEHGEFAAWGRMSESEAPQPCPACEQPARRALAHPAVATGAGEASACNAYPGCGEGMCGAPAPSPHVCGTGCMH
jgi:putative FmdB family regulatory protein